MILVTLGTAPYDFNRALRWCAELIDQGVIGREPIFVQHGVTAPTPLVDRPAVRLRPFVSPLELLGKVEAARIIISHAGQGSTRLLASKTKPFILIPRLKTLNEHVDDHQLGFVQAVSRRGVHYAQSLEELANFIQKPIDSPGKNLFDGPKLVEHFNTLYRAA